MREQVLHYIRERKLLKAGDRVAVAVSGGADSVALLRVLLDLREELGIVLFVAHFNHQLRGEESDADERFVADLAQRFDLQYFAGRADVRQHAKAHNLSLEHAARELRYRWLTDIAREQHFDAIATAHTSDDQAETVLMKFLRGAGTRGLAGIHPLLIRDSTRVVRPLLEITRAEVERYLASLHQPWCEDHSNSDTRMTRNRIRHELLPLLEREYNPNLRQVLSETAKISNEEEAAWEAQAAAFVNKWHQDEKRLLLQLRQNSCFPPLGSTDGFAVEPVALQRRVLRCFLERHGITIEFQHIEKLRLCALGDHSIVNLPKGWHAVREGDWLVLGPPALKTGIRTTNYQHSVPIPGRCLIAEAALTISAAVISAEAATLEPPGTLLRADSVDPELTIRNWHPGDRFRPSHSASEEKLKRLFSEKRIPAEQRPLWPVVLNKDNQIVWVRGFPVAHDFAWVPGSGSALRIEAVPAEPTLGTSSAEPTTK